MKRLSLISSAIIAMSVFAGCASEPQMPILQNQNVNALSEIDNQYVITAYALVDKMAKTPVIAEQEKIIKDFELNIKPLNRFALEKILTYTGQVLSENLKPGEDPRKHPVARLIYSELKRFNDIYRNYSARIFDAIMIAQEKDTAKQNEMIKEFEKAVKKIAKADAKEIISALTDPAHGNVYEYFPKDAPYTKAILKILKDKIAI